MRTIKLKDGSKVSKLGIGTYRIGSNPSKREEEMKAFRYALDFGVNLIDTVEMYGNGDSEEFVGEAIKPYEREDLYLISKFVPSNASKKRLEKSLDASLRRLDTDYLDLYMYHWPGSTPLEETVSELVHLQEAGKIKAWGVSSFDTTDMKKLLALPNGTDCVANQLYYNLSERGIEYELKPLLDQHQITTMAYSPLIKGGKAKHNLLSNPVLKEIAEELGVTVYQVLLLFTLHQENIIPIPKASSFEHMKANCECLNLSFTDEQFQKLDQEFPAPEHATSLALGW
ncbi:aldo/keto reductase [Carnobacteriaceae bacterium 52-44]